MFPIFGKLYDRAGVLWKFLLGGMAHPDYHIKENFGSGVPMLDSAAVIDIQNKHCTTPSDGNSCKCTKNEAQRL